MSTRRPSNPLALAVLTLLAETPMHPYQMSSTLKERRKEDSIRLNFGSLYSVVESLKKRGLVEVRQVLREGNRPERTVYGITAAGQELMTTWLSDLISTPVKEFPQFEAALSLMMILSPDGALSLLRQRLEQLRTNRDSATEMLREAERIGMPRVFGVEHEFELVLLEAELGYVESLVDELAGGQLDGVDMWRRFSALRATGLSEDEVDAALREEFPDRFAWAEQITGEPQRTINNNEEDPPATND